MIKLEYITTDNFGFFKDDILDIEKSCFTSPWSLNAFRQEMHNPVSHLWILRLDKELAGYICFWTCADEIHLVNIAIHPNKRGKGLGRYLLTKMLEAGVSRGVETAWLEVRPSNFLARVLYQKVGFKETGRRLGYYQDTNEDAIVMSLSLFKKEAHPLTIYSLGGCP